MKVPRAGSTARRPPCPPLHPALAVEGIGKRFSGVTALDDVSLEFRSGEVLALMGENGAGKSTLLRVLSGDQGPDDGRLLLDGAEVTFDTPRAAMAAGVRVIYQEPEIIPHVSVAENVFVGELPARARVFNRRTLLKATQDALAEYGFEGVLNPATLGVALSRRPAADRRDPARAHRGHPAARDRLRRADVVAVRARGRGAVPADRAAARQRGRGRLRLAPDEGDLPARGPRRRAARREARRRPAGRGDRRGRAWCG